MLRLSVRAREDSSVHCRPGKSLLAEGVMSQKQAERRGRGTRTGRHTPPPTSHMHPSLNLCLCHPLHPPLQEAKHHQGSSHFLLLISPSFLPSLSVLLYVTLHLEKHICMFLHAHGHRLSIHASLHSFSRGPSPLCKVTVDMTIHPITVNEAAGHKVTWIKNTEKAFKGFPILQSPRILIILLKSFQ